MLKKREGRSQVIGQSRQGHAAPHRTGEDSQIQIYYVSFVGFFFLLRRSAALNHGCEARSGVPKTKKNVLKHFSRPKKFTAGQLLSKYFGFRPGLPDFSWYLIPKLEKCTK
jgi:hypothetical protein